MALTAAQKKTIKTVYAEARNNDFAVMVEELMNLILSGPSASQKAAIRSFMESRKNKSAQTEANLPNETAAKVAQLDAEQADLAVIITELT